MAVSRFFRIQQLHMAGPGKSFEWRCFWAPSSFFPSGVGLDWKLNVHMWGTSGNEIIRYGARAEIEHSGMRAEGKSYTQASGLYWAPSWRQAAPSWSSDGARAESSWLQVGPKTTPR